jgi:ABC-type transport system substrate-binding protein
MYVEQKYDSMLASFGGRQDPATAYAAMYGQGGFLNPGGHVTPGVDEGIVQANAATSIDARAAALSQVGKVLDDNSVGVVFYHKQLIVAYSDKVSGYAPSILGKPKFFGITAP